MPLRDEIESKLNKKKAARRTKDASTHAPGQDKPLVASEFKRAPSAERSIRTARNAGRCNDEEERGALMSAYGGQPSTQDEERRRIARPAKTTIDGWLTYGDLP